MPPSRKLARSLGISRNTAVAAYDLLLSEGYLVARAGAGTFVAHHARITGNERIGKPLPGQKRLSPPPSRIDDAAAAILKGTGTSNHPFDLRPGLSDKSEFPFDVWRRLSARALRGLSKTPAEYMDPEGRIELRQAITSHIAHTRAVVCAADDLVVTNGAQQAFDLIARTFVTPGGVVAFEDPGYPPARAAFAAAGAEMRSVRVDSEGIVVDELPEDARIVFVTPSHQFPLGAAMSLRRRSQLLSWARRTGAIVVEDDYDSEFRFSGRPLDALQMLDRLDDAGGRHVLYVGTFSKSLFPAIRLGFIVTPGWAREALVRFKGISDRHSPVLAQDTLASFILEGHLVRHLRGMRRSYGERRASLLAAVERGGGQNLKILPSEEVGLHFAVAHEVIDEDLFTVEASRIGLNIVPLSRYFVDPRQAGTTGFVVGYGRLGQSCLQAASGKLCGLLAEFGAGYAPNRSDDMLAKQSGPEASGESRSFGGAPS